MPGPGRYDRIVEEQRASLVAALASAAQHAGVALPPGLAERLAAAVQQDTPADADSRLLREAFRDSPPLALVAFDTPGVHDYVFRVSRPVDIAGGSHLVAAFTDSDLAKKVGISSVRQVLTQERHAPGALVFAGGGRGLAVVAAHRAASLRSALAGVLPRATAEDLRTITEELPVWPEDLGAVPRGGSNGAVASSYGAAVSALMGRLARERSRSERFGETIDVREKRRCSACRLRIGTDERSNTGEWICKPCATRRRLGGTLKTKADEAKTFQDLVGEERLAVLYADGANVGAAFQDVDSMARHRALSEAVEEAFDQAVKAVVEAKELQDADERLLFQKPIRGGDDLILILPARSAVEAIGKLVGTVESAFSLQGNALLRDAFADAPPALWSRVERFGVGVGLVVADSHFPAAFLVHYAEELLRSAKSVVQPRAAGAPDSAGAARSAVDYLILESGNPLSDSIRDLRKTHLRTKPRGGDPGRLLTERPFSIAEFHRIVQVARAMAEAEVPATQRFAVRQEILRGYSVSRSFWRYQHARAKENSGWARYREALHAGLDEVDRLLWRQIDPPEGESGAWASTSYLDALDILSLLQEKRRARGNGR